MPVHQTWNRVTIEPVVGKIHLLPPSSIIIISIISITASDHSLDAPSLRLHDLLRADHPRHLGRGVQEGRHPRHQAEAGRHQGRGQDEGGQRHGRRRDEPGEGR